MALTRAFLKQNQVERLVYRELYKKSFYDFVKDFWECCDPNEFVDGFLIQYYCEVFQYACRHWIGYKELDIQIPDQYKDYEKIDVRQDKQNFCVCVPPRHSKTMIFSVLGPVWLWISYPIKAASCSHTLGLSKDINSKRQRLINSEKFKFYFEDEFKLVVNTVDSLIDNRGGELYAKSRDTMTGFGCDLALCDDLSNAEQARKDKQEMANVWSFYQTTLPSRLNNPANGVIINIQQRLAMNDCAGHIMNDRNLSKSYCFISIPAIFDVNTLLICPISGDIFVFKAGDVLWEERFGNYEALRYQVGESIFQCQYLQKPQNSDKTVIKEDMIIKKTSAEVPDISQADMIYASHDFPVKDKETSDFLGSILAYKVNSTLYIKDCLEKRMAFVQSISYAQGLENAYGSIVQVIEDKANGSPIIQQLQDKISGVQPFQPGTQSKTQRLESATVYMTSGDVVFVADVYNKLTGDYEISENLKNLILRLLNFPFVEHDDIVDAFSQLVLYVFMDRRYMVYGRSFNAYNCIDYQKKDKDFSTVFFNKEGDLWKVCEIAVRYGEETKIFCTREIIFKASADQALDNFKIFAPDKKVFIDCSASESFYGVSRKDMYTEYYETDDFEGAVAALNLAFGSKLVLLDNSCKGVKADIESFKYDKTKDETATFRSTHDGFVACLRTALKYYGI